jgi:hypothetical protein
MFMRRYSWSSRVWRTNQTDLTPNLDRSFLRSRMSNGLRVAPVAQNGRDDLNGHRIMCDESGRD